MPRTKEAFQQIRNDTKAQILRLAGPVFAKKGLAGTKIEDLAEAAGVSQGLLYRYFINKEEMFVQLLEQIDHRANDYVQAGLTREGSPWEKLCWVTEQFLKGISHEPMFNQLFSQAFSLSGNALQSVREMKDIRKTMRQLIVDGQMVGQVSKRDPDQLVLLYFCCLYGWAMISGLSADMNTHFLDAEAILQILR